MLGPPKLVQNIAILCLFWFQQIRLFSKTFSMPIHVPFTCPTSLVNMTLEAFISLKGGLIWYITPNL